MKKILVIRFSSIGDIVLTTPVVRSLKEQLDSTEIHYLTKPQFGAILSGNPYIDQVHFLNKNISDLIKDLKQEDFDCIIDLHRNLRTSRIKMLLRKPAYTFPKLNIQKWLTVNFKTKSLPSVHIVDRYFKAVQPLKVQNDGKGLDYFIPKDDEVDLETMAGTNNVLAVAIGAQFATKRLPVEKLVEVLKEVNTSIVLLGGPTDVNAAKELVAKLPGQKTINKCGELSLNQSASVVRQSKALLTHDTGLMHIASAFDTPIVSVWGNTIPAFGMYPYRKEAENNVRIHQVEGLSCRPCSKIGFQKCPKGHFKCMNEQNVNAITTDLNTFLE